MKKILFVATRQFWPITTGKEITLYHNCKGLHEKYGYDIYLFCFADKKANKDRERPFFIHDVKYVDTPGAKKAIPSVLKNSFIIRKWPIQNSLFFNEEIATELISYYDVVKPDIVIIDMVRLVPYSDLLPKKEKIRILIEDDLLAKRYSRQKKNTGVGNVTGYFSASVPNIVNKIVNNKNIKNLVLSMEINRLNSYEELLPSKFDYVTFISPIEAAEFNALHKTDKGITLTMGADIKYCAGGIPNTHIPKSMSIVGNFSYAPNAASLEWVCREVLPRLDNDITYHVIGKCPENLKQKIADPRVIFYGYVDDVRPVVKSTDIYFAPIAYGTGIKTKIVEGMAMGMPVITNSVGAEGLNIRNGNELFVYDSTENIINCINLLFKDEQKRKEVARNAQQFVATYHDWECVYDTFGKMGL